MENIIEYVENNLKTFADTSFNAVDSLVLSKLSYIRFEGIVPLLRERRAPVRMGELLKAELYPSMFANTRDIENNRRFLFALAASPRFRNICLCHYVNNSDPALEKQFSAVTCLLEDKTAYIVYRGTDATFVGWKEDFNMAYLSCVPSQQEGAKYLNTVAGKLPRQTGLRVGGHSKGGNIAIFSAVFCDPNVQKRIVSVYNHDGPGFKDNIYISPEFLRIKSRIHTTLPEASFVGMLLQNHEDYLVVKSSRHGIAQHDPFTWYVDNDDFCYAQDISSSAQIRSKTLDQWLNAQTDDKRKLIVDVLFDILEKTDNENFLELTDEWHKSAVSILAAIKNVDPETKKIVMQMINELARLSIKNIFKTKQNSV